MYMKVVSAHKYYDPVEVVNEFFQKQFNLRPLTAREWNDNEEYHNVCRMFNLSPRELCNIAQPDFNLHVIECRGKIYAHPDSIITWYKKDVKKNILKNATIH